MSDIPLGNNGARFDYQSLNLETDKLYIAHMGADQMIVYDTLNHKVIETVPDVPNVHGILAVPGTGRIYATATGINSVVAIDENDLHRIAAYPTGKYPDGLAYDPVNQKLFISDEHGGSVTVINIQTDEREATIPLGGEVGNTQYDPETHHIFAAEQTHNQLVEIDPKLNTIINKVDLSGCEAPHGVNIPAAFRIAFIACENNAKLVTLDLNTMQTLSIDEVGGSPDVLAFDEGLSQLYVASESGTLAIFKEDITNPHVGFRKVAQTYVAPGAHTIAVNQKTHQVYFPLESKSGHPVLRIYEPE